MSIGGKKDAESRKRLIFGLKVKTWNLTSNKPKNDLVQCRLYF